MNNIIFSKGDYTVTEERNCYVIWVEDHPRGSAYKFTDQPSKDKAFSDVKISIERMRQHDQEIERFIHS